LTNRYQRVVIADGVSEWLSVTSGVPQGSILGPLSFLIYINDLPDAISMGTKTAIFADDTKIYREITSINDVSSLQLDLNHIIDWSEINELGFNPSKCQTIKIKRQAPKPDIKLTIR